MLNTNLVRLLSEKHISTALLQAQIGAKSAKTALNKLNRKTPFTLGEALLVMELFPEYTLDYVFEGYSDLSSNKERD